jgi:hypothetical protein
MLRVESVWELNLSNETCAYGFEKDDLEDDDDSTMGTTRTLQRQIIDCLVDAGSSGLTLGVYI